MDNNVKAEKLTEIVNNEEILTKISNADTKEEMQGIFAANGLDMTMAEVDAFIHMMNMNGKEEVSEAQLESVTGGAIDAVWIFTQSWKGIKKIAGTCWNAGKWFADQGW